MKHSSATPIPRRTSIDRRAPGAPDAPDRLGRRDPRDRPRVGTCARDQIGAPRGAPRGGRRNAPQRPHHHHGRSTRPRDAGGAAQRSTAVPVRRGHVLQRLRYDAALLPGEGVAVQRPLPAQHGGSHQRGPRQRAALRPEDDARVPPAERGIRDRDGRQVLEQVAAVDAAPVLRSFRDDRRRVPERRVQRRRHPEDRHGLQHRRDRQLRHAGPADVRGQRRPAVVPLPGDAGARTAPSSRRRPMRTPPSRPGTRAPRCSRPIVPTSRRGSDSRRPRSPMSRRHVVSSSGP